MNDSGGAITDPSLIAALVLENPTLDWREIRGFGNWVLKEEWRIGSVRVVGRRENRGGMVLVVGDAKLQPLLLHISWFFFSIIT